MNLEEIMKYRKQQTRKCDICGLTKTIVCSDTNFPEYKEEIYIQCVCGNYIEFIIPVN